jgi:hypothetical protein
MAAKVAEAVAVARLGTPVLIAEAGTQHAYRACCSPLDTLLQDGTGGRQQQALGQQSTVWQGTAVVLKKQHEAYYSCITGFDAHRKSLH